MHGLYTYVGTYSLAAEIVMVVVRDLDEIWHKEKHRSLFQKISDWTNIVISSWATRFYRSFVI